MKTELQKILEAELDAELDKGLDTEVEATPRNVLLYAGKGAYQSSADGWAKRLLDRGHAVTLAAGHGFIRELRYEQHDFVVLPGGHTGDPARNGATYKDDLGSDGEAAIKDYVSNGGVILGVCGGAYLLVDTIEFHKYGGDVLNSEGYGLIPANAYNVEPYRNTAAYQGYKLSRVLLDDETLQVFYNGGPRLDFNRAVHHQVLAQFVEDREPCSVSLQYGFGRVVTLSVHPELKMQTGAHIPEDYRDMMARVEEDHNKVLDRILTHVDFWVDSINASRNHGALKPVALQRG